MPAIGGQHLSWLCLFGRLTGDAKGVLDGGEAIFFVHNLAFDHKNLADTGEIKVVVERRAAPDAPCLDASVIRRAEILMVWCGALVKQQRDVFFNLETAVGRARVGCDGVRWQGERCGSRCARAHLDRAKKASLCLDCGLQG